MSELSKEYVDHVGAEGKKDLENNAFTERLKSSLGRQFADLEAAIQHYFEAEDRGQPEEDAIMAVIVDIGQQNVKKEAAYYVRGQLGAQIQGDLDLRLQAVEASTQPIPPGR